MYDYFSCKMKLLLIFLIASSGCATTYSHIRNERVGPTEVEIWRNNKTNECEQRIYLDSMYFVTSVPCSKK